MSADGAVRGTPGRTERVLLGAAGLACLAGLVELLPRLGLVDPRSLPPASAIAGALAERLLTLETWLALGATLATWGLGLALAGLAGVVAGLLLGPLRPMREATASTIEFLRPIPSVALIPLAVLLFGTGRPATLLLVVYAAFWQVLVPVLHGVRALDPVARDTARAFRLPPRARVCAVLWPVALPYTVTGLRLAASVALILTVTGELMIGTPGLGSLVSVAHSSGAVTGMYALVLLTGVLGLLVNLGLRAVERRLLRWHPAVRRELS